MKEESNEAEIVQLINFYETNPCLCDPAVKDYRNKDRKITFEGDIAIKLGKTSKFCWFRHTDTKSVSSGLHNR